jgi:hypothetical protein
MADSITPRFRCFLLIVTGLCFTFLRGRLHSAEPPPEAIKTIEIVGSRGAFEVAQYDASGNLLRRWTGFEKIGAIQAIEGDQLLVYDSGAERIVILDSSGEILRAWPSEGMDIHSIVYLKNGGLLLALGDRGVVELGADGGERTHIPPPAAGASVVSAVRLADGTDFCGVRGGEVPVYVIPQRAEQMLPLGFRPRQGQWRNPVLLACPSEKILAVIDPAWTERYLLAWSEGGLTNVEAVPMGMRLLAIAPDGAGGCWMTHLGYRVTRETWRGGILDSFLTVEQPLDAAAGPNGTVYLSIKRRPLAKRTTVDKWLPPSDHVPFAWGRFTLWIVASLVVLAILHGLIWRRGSARKDKELTGAAGACVQSETGLSFAVRAHLKIWAVCVGLTVAGMVLPFIGHSRLVSGQLVMAAIAYPSGALLAAGAMYWWRRSRGGESRQWVEEVGKARMPSSLRVVTWATVAVVLSGCVLLGFWRFRGTHYHDSVGLWAALMVLCTGPAVFARRRSSIRLQKDQFVTLVQLILLVAAASVALGYDLAHIPLNFHYDFGEYFRFSLALLKGYAPNIFVSGKSDIPLPGHLITVLGILIAGPRVIAARLGSVLGGLIAIVGVYAIGREYGGRRMGFLSGVFLIGLVPFVHYARSGCCGDMMPFVVWSSYAFLRGIRTGRPGPWLLCGLLSGWCMLVYYPARIQILVFVVAGIFFLARFRRSALAQWYAPLLWLVGFSVVILPMMPYWLSHPEAFRGRMDGGFELYTVSEGFRWALLPGSFGRPLVRTLGMFYNQADTAVMPASLSPGCGTVEGVLLSIGLVVALTDGWQVNAFCLIWLIVAALGGGAWTPDAPNYMRLLPLTAVASVFMARSVEGMLSFVRVVRPWQRTASFIAVILIVASAVVYPNLRAYVRFERTHDVWDWTAFGWAMLRLGHGYQFYTVTTHREDFSCKYYDEFTPFLIDLDVEDLRDPAITLPFPKGRPVAVAVPFYWDLDTPRPQTPAELVETFRKRYPDMKVKEVSGTRDGKNELLGVICVIDP